MQFTVINENNSVLNISAKKLSNVAFVFAVIVFFMNLVLHNYNNSQENVIREVDYSSNTSKALNIATVEPLVNQTPSQESIIQVVPQEQLKPVIPEPKQTNVKKIGNVTIMKLEKGNTLFDVIFHAGFAQKQSHIIAEMVSKKYRLNTLKISDVIQIINLTKQNSALINLKIIIGQKAEIIVKGKSVMVKKINEKPIEYVQNDHYTQKAFTVQHSIKRLKLVFDDSTKAIQTTPVSQEIKRDLMSIVQLLKQDTNFQYGIMTMNVVYEKKSVRREKLLCVNVSNSRTQVKVYKYYDKSGTAHYVKQDGMLLLRQKTFASSNLKLSYPIHNPVIGSGFGMRHHPIMKRVKMHKGIDFRAQKGTPIHAPADGIIVSMTNSRGFGKHVKIRHNGTYSTLYAHLDAFSSKSVGSRVSRGDVIGYVGRSGLASGEHLHFEVHENGRPINPLRLISNAVYESQPSQLTRRQLIAFKSYQSDVNRRIQS